MITLSIIIRPAGNLSQGRWTGCVCLSVVIFAQPRSLLQQMVLLTEIGSRSDPDFCSHVGSIVVATVTGASWWVFSNLKVAADNK